MQSTRTRPSLRHQPARRGQASLDYVLVLGVILPIVAFVLPTGQRIITLVYEMILVMLSWPFL